MGVGFTRLGGGEGVAALPERLGHLEGVLIARKSIEAPLRRPITTCGSEFFLAEERDTLLHSCVAVSSALQTRIFGLVMR